MKAHDRAADWPRIRRCHDRLHVARWGLMVPWLGLVTTGLLGRPNKPPRLHGG